MLTSVRLVFAGLLLAAAPSAHSTIIEFDLTNISGNQWRYDYYVTNDSLEAPIEEFTIWFDRALYESLSSPIAPAGWDSLGVQPDLNLPDDGFYDSLSLSAGIAPGQTLSGFSVLFDWLGTNAPGSQLYQVVDPVTFDSIDSGITRERTSTPPSTSVPEPASLGLMMCSVTVMLFLRRRRTSRLL